MTKTYKRALSNAQAAACENAKYPRCQCRCGGALHGKGHASYQAQERNVIDQQKELPSEQIAEIIKALPLAKPATLVNYANLANEIAVQGRLPLEVR